MLSVRRARTAPDPQAIAEAPPAAVDCAYPNLEEADIVDTGALIWIIVAVVVVIIVVAIIVWMTSRRAREARANQQRSEAQQIRAEAQQSRDRAQAESVAAAQASAEAAKADADAKAAQLEADRLARESDARQSQAAGLQQETEDRLRRADHIDPDVTDDRGDAAVQGGRHTRDDERGPADGRTETDPADGRNP
jgi:cytoskeletal protein RodZ